jgi:hypothetical protein
MNFLRVHTDGTGVAFATRRLRAHFFDPEDERSFGSPS